MGERQRVYPAELRERTVRIVQESVGQHESQRAAIKSVARMLRIGIGVGIGGVGAEVGPRRGVGRS
jgi:hypothetical protein